MSGPKPAVDTTVLIGGVAKVTPDPTTQSVNAVTFETVPGVDTGFVPFTIKDKQKLDALAATTPPPQPNDSWSQAAWFVDPANSTGFANDTNDGATALTPVRSYNGGIVAKWGTTAPVLRQSTTLTWLSSQPGDSDPVVMNPTLVSGQLVIQGQLPTPAHTGALAGVVAKARGNPGQLLEATLGYASTAGDLIVNTTAGKASTAYVYVAGAPATLTQPITSPTLPLEDGAPLPTEVNTWANTDTFDAYQLFTVNIVRVECNIAELIVSPAFLTPAVVMHINFGGAVAGVSTIGEGVSVVECSVSAGTVFVDASVNNEILTYFWNLFIPFDAQGAHPGGSNTPAFLAGALISAGGASQIDWNLSLDTIIDATLSAITIGGSFNIANAEPALGAVFIKGILAVEGVLNCNPAVLWGPGTLDAVGSSRIFYGSSSAVTTFGNLNALLLNGQGSANPFTPATGVWSAAVTLTAAHLDASIGAGGFAGLATNVGGASFTSQQTP